MVEFDQNSQGGFPENPNARLLLFMPNGRPWGRNTGIDWSPYNEARFKVDLFFETSLQEFLIEKC